MKTQKLVFALFVSFSLLSAGRSAEASQFAECKIDSHDACPNLLIGPGCIRYTVWGRDFETKDWFAYPLARAKKRAKALDELDQLIVQGVCPGRHGNQPQSSIDPKYREAAEKDAARLGKKLFRFMKRF